MVQVGRPLLPSNQATPTKWAGHAHQVTKPRPPSGQSHIHQVTKPRPPSGSGHAHLSASFLVSSAWSATDERRGADLSRDTSSSSAETAVSERCCCFFRCCSSNRFSSSSAASWEGRVRGRGSRDTQTWSGHSCTLAYMYMYTCMSWQPYSKSLKFSLRVVTIGWRLHVVVAHSSSFSLRLPL